MHIGKKVEGSGALLSSGTILTFLKEIKKTIRRILFRKASFRTNCE